ncbi:FecCD family ABC transporter permease [Xylanimonas protaetiae]|uniref:Iron complex transport system permease protein n=1 Tax=Xylanimonas protaetiae TaxID=2509457 RepID=A0A4P6F6A0_9MICO|nr:iron chelate uptake ABC transporter family permease subunit [Xylanimonas protaetiae]QAY71272.1 hypothetical protein ET471_15570 [Xylanimonas protaetiae]
MSAVPPVAGLAARLAARRRARTAVVTASVLGALLGVVLFGLVVGDVPTSPAEVLAALLGGGDQRTQLVVVGLRLPRLVTGAVVGAALGASGALFQSLTRNPLGSPDVVGFTAGSATGALVAIVVLGGGTAAVAGGALAGGLACALAVLALSSSGGTTTGHRFVLVGIGTAAVLTSANGYLLTRASLGDATAAQTWLVGSLDARGWETAVPLLVAVGVLLPVALAAQRTLALLDLGDDLAAALGVDVPRARLGAVVVGIALAAAGTAAAGPVGFVALAAPQLARRLTRGSGAGAGAAAALGALLLVTSDVVAQRALAPVVLPVGVVTGLVGGVYLAWLLGTGRARSGPR